MSQARVKLLIVDDEPEVLESLRRTLRRENFDLTVTTSPLRALEHLCDDQVDILISDIDMPELNGLELIAEARRTNPHVLRILLTGDVSAASALTAINDGAVHKYLTKPWSAAELRLVLRELASGLDAPRRVQASPDTAHSDESLRRNLQQCYPGIADVARVEGAYLLDDTRLADQLSPFGGVSSTFAASRWLPAADDATRNLRKPRPPHLPSRDHGRGR